MTFKARFSMLAPSRFVLILLFLVLSISFIFYQLTHKQRVFILHSYHHSMPWVKNLERGIDQVFKNKQYVDLRYFYMNTKRRSSEAYLRRISREALSAIRQYQPDVLIVFDSDAQRLVASKLLNNKNYKIVFAGVTPSAELDKFRLANNITGILEKIPVQAVKEVLALMLPNKKRIYYLSDNSITAQQLDKDMPQSKWQPYQLVRSRRVTTFSAWQQAILEAQKKADFILVSTYQMITEGHKQISPQKLVSWTLAHSKVPVIGLYESFIESGGYLAIAVASYEQGYTAAKIANFILENKLAINAVPFVNSQMFQLQLRKQKVLKHYPQVTIPVILEAFSKTKWQLDDMVLPSTPSI